MGGWMDGWKGGKAGLRIAYSNQKMKLTNFVSIFGQFGFHALGFYCVTFGRTIVIGYSSNFNETKFPYIFLFLLRFFTRERL